MYDRNYYAQVDDAMMKLLKDFGRRLLHVLDGTMRYVLTLPIRASGMWRARQTVGSEQTVICS